MNIKNFKILYQKKNTYNATRLLHHFIHHSFEADVCVTSKAIRCATKLKSKQIDEKMREEKKTTTQTRENIYSRAHIKSQPFYLDK